MKNISLIPHKIIRQPLFPLSNYNTIPKKSENLDNFIDSLFFNKKFSEAVYLSSPSLYEEWEKIVNGEKNRGKLNESILKYYLRSVSNTVPFGLFTLYSISSARNQNYERFSNIDMEYLLKLIDYLNNNPLVRRVCNFRKNNSIYKVGDKYRYIEPKYTENNLNYVLSSIDSDELLDFLINQGNETVSYDNLKKNISDLVQDVTEKDVEFYINQLIDLKIYISCLEVGLNEENLLTQIINFYKENINSLKKDEKLKLTFESLIEVNDKILDLDKNVFNSKDAYENIFKKLKKIDVPFQKKYVINSNLRDKTLNHFQEKKIDSKIKKLLSCLLKISQTNIKEKTNLDLFKERFYNRYEDQEVLLLEVLDNELGIGYLPRFEEDVIFSDLIDDITIFPRSETISEKKVEPQKYNFWMNLLINNSDKKEIDLANLNLDLLYNEKKLLNNASFSLSYTYANDKVFLKHIGGTTGTNLIGRFSNNDTEMQKVIDNVSDFEKLQNKDKITAEILHLPTNRAGNILIRKINREAEISLVSKTSRNSKVIDANDLYISIRGNKIILRSKKENKEVVPFLSSAQNFHYNSLPIYHFLCDLQIQDRLINLSPNYGGFNIGDLDYCPRLVYGKDVVIRKATWLLKKYHYKSISELDEYLKIRKVPRFIYITNKGEDKMIIDRENFNTLSVLFNEISKNNIVTISECIYDMTNANQFANEFISIIKSQNSEKVLTNNIITFNEDEKNKKIKRFFIYGDEWIYFKIYTGRVISDTILTENISKVANRLLKDQIIDKWFFIRYTDPEFHLRVRFHLTSDKNYGEVSKIINQELSKLVEENKIWKLDLSTYKRELERYHWSNIDNSETIFSIDSNFTIKLLKYLKHKKNNRVWFYILKSIDDFFNAFEISLEGRHKIVNRMFNSFWIEYGELKSIKKDVNSKFRKHSKELIELLNIPNGELKSIYEERLEELKQIEHNKNFKNNISDLLWSYIHMHVNRFMQSNPRFHELIMYGILERYYSQEIGKKKYNQKIIQNEIY